MNMKALSVRPPWAYYIIYGIPYGISVDIGEGRQRIEDSGKVIIKDVENRLWGTDFRGRIYIHVSGRDDPIESVLEFGAKLGLPYGYIMLSYSRLLPRGAIIGEVDIIDCVKDSKSPWAVPGQYHIVLANPTPYKVHVPCKGKLGFFEPDIDMLSEMKKTNGKS